MASQRFNRMSKTGARGLGEVIPCRSAALGVCDVCIVGKVNRSDNDALSTGEFDGCLGACIAGKVNRRGNDALSSDEFGICFSDWIGSEFFVCVCDDCTWPSGGLSHHLWLSSI